MDQEVVVHCAARHEPLDAWALVGVGALSLAGVGAAAGVGLAVSANRAAAEANGRTRREAARHTALAVQVERDRTHMAVYLGLGASLAFVGLWALLGPDDDAGVAAVGPTSSEWVIRW